MVIASVVIVMFYTYLYQRTDGTPYYVGKGKGRRAFKQLNHHVPVPPAARIVVQYWTTETEALSMERYYISLFGRKNSGTGILRNLTDGGDGVSGFLCGSAKENERCREETLCHESRARTPEENRRHRSCYSVGRVVIRRM